MASRAARKLHVPAPEVKAEPASRFIVGPYYDSILLIAPPVIAWVLSLFVFRIEHAPTETLVYLRPWTDRPDLPLVLNTVFIQAHLILVSVRTHLNRTVFARHPIRFTVVPIALYLVGFFSIHVVVLLHIVALLWDVYHSSAQNFGIARIYEARAGNATQEGRTADLLLAHSYYIAPCIAGVNFLPALALYLAPAQSAPADLSPQVSWLAQIPLWITPWKSFFNGAAVAFMVLAVSYYLFTYGRLIARGYRFSLPKLAFVGVTALTNFLVWLFLPLAVAAFIANFYHAMQYFGIVWSTEHGNLERLMAIRRGAKALALFLMVAGAFAYGIFVPRIAGGTTLAVVHLLNVVAVMHYWYDGFVWSVRKRQV